MIEQHIQPQPVNTACRLRVFWVRHRDIFFLQGTGDQIWLSFHRSNTVPATLFFCFSAACFNVVIVQRVKSVPRSRRVRRSKQQDTAVMRQILLSVIISCSSRPFEMGWSWDQITRQWGLLRDLSGLYPSPSVSWDRLQTIRDLCRTKR